MSFDVSRLRRSDWMVGGGAVAFFIFLFFFDWYGGSYKGTVPVGGGSFGASVSSTGWDTFTNSRWIWLLTILVSIAAVVLVAGQRKLELPVRLSTVVLGLGALSTLLILYRIVHHPSGGVSFAGASFSYGIKVGIWLGLIAAAVIAYGGYLMMGEEDSSPELGGYRPPASSSTPTPPASPATPSTSAAAEPPLPPSAPSGTGL
jgi:Mn2+/Fe2+ NRAMP family transporter